MEYVFEQLCEECRNYMVNTGPDENNKETALHLTVKSKHDECTDMLLEAGADVNCLDFSYYTPLMGAAENGCVKGVEMLVQAGADVNSKNADCETALVLAALKGHEDCIELLLNAGADIYAGGPQISYWSSCRSGFQTNKVFGVVS